MDSLLEEASSFIFSLEKSAAIKIVAHYDADGICAAAILKHALAKAGYGCSIISEGQLDDDLLSRLSAEDFELFIFADIGATHAGLIDALFKKKVIILDHHYAPQIRLNSKIVHANPHYHGIDGSGEISGAGCAFLLAEKMDPSNVDISHLAVIGAIGDSQEKQGFKGLNKEILKKAVDAKKIKIEEGLRIFGAYSRSLSTLLKQSTDLHIPGVTGSYSAVSAFLKSLGIDPSFMLSDLKENQKEKLKHALFSMLDTRNKERLLGKNYVMLGESGHFAEAKEFATVLNACGRLSRAEAGVGACLGDDAMKSKALECLKEYREEIAYMINWFKDHRGTKDVAESRNYIIINTHNGFLPSMAGTLASVLAHSSEIGRGKYILILARSNDKTKVSLRYSGGTFNTKVHLNDILRLVIQDLNASCGGHKNAAGAVIDPKDEEEFMKKAAEVFSNTLA